MDQLSRSNPDRPIRRYNIYDDDEENEVVNVLYDEPDQQLAQPIQDEDIFLDAEAERQGEKSPPPAPRSNAHLTPKERMKQSFAEQVKNLGMIPKKIDPKQKYIDLGTKTPPKLKLSATASKVLTIDKFFKPVNRPTDTVTPEKKRISRDEHIRSLEKKICADKRKIWDSTRAPIDDFDEEEQNIADISDDEDENAAPEDNADNDGNDDKTDEHELKSHREEDDEEEINARVIDDNEDSDESVMEVDDHSDEDLDFYDEEDDEPEVAALIDDAAKESKDGDDEDDDVQLVNDKRAIDKNNDDDDSDIDEVKNDRPVDSDSDDSDIVVRPKRVSNRIVYDEDDEDDHVDYQLNLDD